ncbi:MAG TPA: hypothetical protein ENG87_03210 [Candidatus Pacearchaeota archaeon]|nr:hypothetical protein [Candidatus Pacearchaeota archaeon]HDZ61176.1 hypothetical protein [Candidatus Pacearchaeota archaeon]
MIDKKTIAIIVLGIIVLSMGSIYAYSYITNQAYQQGIVDATMLINQQILNNLEQNGYIVFMYNLGNETVPIKLGIIQDGN